VRAVGALTARLHQQGAAYLTAEPVGALVHDAVLSFRISNRLADLRPRFGTVLEDAVDRAQRDIDALWGNPPHPPHLFHGDVNLGNVLVDGDRVTLVDFQDLFWGFEIQDVVIATVSLPHADAFRAGYESVRPWPEAEPSTVAALEAARRLNILNFGLHPRRPDHTEFVARVAAPVVAWMSDG
jgi:Ser/Thr protein kinase RdoA (MazF antagonist)